MISPAMEDPEENQVKQVAIGASVLITIGILVPGALVGWRHIPGVLGDWIGTTAGILTTPFFMETTFVILGLVIVVTLNHWRRIHDGDEFVCIEPSDDTGTHDSLTNQSSPLTPASAAQADATDLSQEEPLPHPSSLTQTPAHDERIRPHECGIHRAQN